MVTVALPDTLSLVAVIVAVPTPTAATVPDVDTVATPVLLEVHVTGRPVSVDPAWSLSVAESCTAPPT
jgi:hypothetical protein